MVQSPKHETTPDPELAALREEFPGWTFFRARRSLDPDKREGDYVATLGDASVGVDRTVMHTTPDAMRKALIEQAEMVRAGRRAVTLSYLGPS